jgi:hypothetical protein
MVFETELLDETAKIPVSVREGIGTLVDDMESQPAFFNW